MQTFTQFEFILNFRPECPNLEECFDHVKRIITLYLQNHYKDSIEFADQHSRHSFYHCGIKSFILSLNALLNMEKVIWSKLFLRFFLFLNQNIHFFILLHNSSIEKSVSHFLRTTLTLIYWLRNQFDVSKKVRSFSDDISTPMRLFDRKFL